MHRIASWALSAALLAPAGCFYTTAINDRPDAEIDIVTEGPYYYPGDSISVSADRSSDTEDGVPATCAWDALDVSVTQSCFAPFTFKIPSQSHRPVEVHLLVEDSEGATATDIETVQVGNRPPVVDISLPPARTEHYVATRPIEVSATVSDDDGDADIEVTWELVMPRGAGPDVELEPIEGSPLAYRFTPDIAGIWRVDVTADDGIREGRATYRREIAVLEDQPPCIAATLPLTGQPGRIVLGRDEPPRSFEVHAVLDDLDPYPRPSDSPGEASFTWYLASPDTGGEVVPVAGAVASTLAIDPSIYAPGALVDVRVEVRDRVARSLPCPPSEPACAMGGDACHQRLSWGVEIR